MSSRAKTTVKSKISLSPTAAEERGIAAAKAMSEALLAEHKRWNMPLITWKNGKIVSVNP